VGEYHHGLVVALDLPGVPLAEFDRRRLPLVELRQVAQARIEPDLRDRLDLRARAAERLVGDAVAYGQFAQRLKC
jgi:hypothetical protein